MKRDHYKRECAICNKTVYTMCTVKLIPLVTCIKCTPVKAQKLQSLKGE